MIDVVHSVNLDQRLDFPHDQYFPNNTPATIATTTPVQASFGFDLPGELTQSTSCVNNFFEIPNWTLIAAMTFQLSDQDININNSPQSNVSPSQQQNSRQYNDMAATAFSNQHQYSHDSSVQQTSILPSPPFVEPSGNYIAISSATNNTQTLPYGYPPSTLPTSNTQSITLTNNLDNGNHIGNNYSSINSINSRNAYNTQQQHHQQQQQQHQQQHHHHQQQQQQHHHQQQPQPQPSRIEITNQLIPGYNFNPNQCYQTSIPSSIGNNSQHHGNHQKPISRSINNFSRQDATTNLPISIAPNLFMQQFNNQTSNGSTMLVPLYDPSTIFTAKPTPTPTPVSTTISISQNSTTTSESTSPTKQTYSYSGPPKSYYSRLPLYDRPFKCDQCPQSFNRNHDLKRHKRIHLAVKPYPCQYCEKQFSRKDALKRHVLVKGCNNTSNNKKSTSSNNNNGSNNNNNKNVIESPSNSSISTTTTIENYVDNGDPIKTEPTNDNGFEISI